MRVRSTIFAILPVVMTGAVFAGSGNRAGTNGASELMIPVGTRDIALAGATTAMVAGIDALFVNPAGTAAFANSIGLFASHMNYIGETGVDCGLVAVNIERMGVLSLYVKSLSFGDIPITTTLTPDGSGQFFRPQYFSVGLNVARQLTDRVAVGLTAILITERIAEVSATGVAFSAGVKYDKLAGVQGLSLGVAVRNIGPQMRFDGPGLNIEATPSSLDRPAYSYRIDAASFELPSTIDFGLAYRTAIADDHFLQFCSSFQSNNFSDDEYKFGLEYAFKDLLFFRGGYDLQPPESDVRENLFGLCFGAGVHTTVGSVDISFDYAFRSVKFFGGNHIFSVTLGL